MREFGEYLRSERLAHGITLEEIEQRTRIRKQHLIAIEAGEFHRLPEAAYVRAFLRHYATSVGLDPQSILDRYEQLSNASATSEVAAASSTGRSERRLRQLRARRRRRAWQWVALLLVIAIALAVRFSGEIQTWIGSLEVFSRSQMPSSDELPEVDDAATSDDSGPSLPVSEPDSPSEDDVIVAADEGPQTHEPNHEELPTAEPPEVTTATEPEDEPVTDPATVDQAPSMAIDLQADPVVVPASQGVAGFTLGLDVIATSWAELYADGERLLYRNLEPGEKLSYVVEGEASLRLGRASDVLLSLNGEPIGSIGIGVASKRFVLEGAEL